MESGADGHRWYGGRARRDRPHRIARGPALGELDLRVEGVRAQDVRGGANGPDSERRLPGTPARRERRKRAVLPLSRSELSPNHQSVPTERYEWIDWRRLRRELLFHHRVASTQYLGNDRAPRDHERDDQHGGGAPKRQADLSDERREPGDGRRIDHPDR